MLKNSFFKPKLLLKNIRKDLATLDKVAVNYTFCFKQKDAK